MWTDTVLSTGTPIIVTHFILTTYHYYLHFTDTKTEIKPPMDSLSATQRPLENTSDTSRGLYNHGVATSSCNPSHGYHTILQPLKYFPEGESASSRHGKRNTPTMMP